MSQMKQEEIATNAKGIVSHPDPEVVVKGEKRQFSAAYKQRIVEEAAQCRNGEVGALLDADFAQLLRQLVEATTGRSRVPITCQVEGEYQRLLPEVRIAFYRTTQEALNNVAKHAAATTAAVTFCCQPATVALTIQDNGIGFDFQGMAGGHFGLINMRERMSAIGGDLQITSAPGQSVCVTATWQPPR